MNNPLSLEVVTPFGFAGDLFFSDHAKHYVFRYDRQAIPAHDLCLSMPVRIDEYPSDQLHPIFQMNLPEGFLLDELKRRLSKVARLDPMMLLAISGSGHPIGRVRVRAPEAVTRPQRLSWPGNQRVSLHVHGQGGGAARAGVLPVAEP